MTSESPVEFWGRIYQGKLFRDAKNMDFTVADLKAMPSLKGKPVWLEHNGQTGDVGIIRKSWVDIARWMWIYGQLHGPEQIGDLHHEIRKSMKDGVLKDLSLHWVGQADNNTGVVDPQSKAVIEVSLTKEGLFDGTNLLSVAANADSNLKTLHVRQPGHSFSLQKPQQSIAMSEDLRSIQENMQKQFGVTLTEDELRRTNSNNGGIDAALVMLDKFAELAEKKDSEFTTKEQDIMQQSQLGEGQKKELEDLRAFREGIEKQYAADQAKNAAAYYSAIEKRIPEDQRESVKDRLNTLASNSQYKGAWDLVKLYAETSMNNEKQASDYSKQIARAKKEYGELQNERDTLVAQHRDQALSQQVELAASSSSAKRGIDKTEEAHDTPKHQKLEKPSTKHIELAASKHIAEANFYFGKAIGIGPPADNEFTAALDNLASKATLTQGNLPTVNWSHYVGYNTGPAPNQDGIVPFPHF